MTDDLHWHFPVTISDLPAGGEEFELVPDEKVRAALAQRAGVSELLALVAKVKVQPEGRTGASVTGVLEALVRQTCVVTLDPFENSIREPIALHFVPESELIDTGGGTEDVGEADPPDPLVDGKLDLAEVVAEFLTLSIDPYPRRPGAVFEAPIDSPDDEKASPFAALARLKPGNDGPDR